MNGIQVTRLKVVTLKYLTSQEQKKIRTHTREITKYSSLVNSLIKSQKIDILKIKKYKSIIEEEKQKRALYLGRCIYGMEQ